MQLSSENIMEIQLRRRFCSARYLLPPFKYFEQSESKVKGGRISSLVSVLFLFSFILNILSRYQCQVPQEFTYGSLSSSTVLGTATLPSGCIFWSKGKDHFIPPDFGTIHCNSILLIAIYTAIKNTVI